MVFKEGQIILTPRKKRRRTSREQDAIGNGSLVKRGDDYQSSPRTRSFTVHKDEEQLRHAGRDTIMHRVDAADSEDGSDGHRDTRMERATPEDPDIEDVDASFQDEIDEDKFFSQMSMLLNHRPSADRGSFGR